MVDHKFTKLISILNELENISKSIDINKWHETLVEIGATNPELLEDARSFLRYLNNENRIKTSFISLLRDLIRFGFGVSQLPERIGHYEILDLIDEGGIGIVYLGYQKEPVTRKVVIKV